MRVTAREAYAVSAAVELAGSLDEYRTADSLAQSQYIPAKFLQGILTQLRQAGILSSRRGADGGYRLAKPAASILIADIFRAVETLTPAARATVTENTGARRPRASLQNLNNLLESALYGALENVTLGTLAQRRATFAATPA
jgi:Rrf2 family protein